MLGTLESELEIQTSNNELQKVDWKSVRDIIFHFKNG